MHSGKLKSLVLLLIFLAAGCVPLCDGQAPKWTLQNPLVRENFKLRRVKGSISDDCDSIWISTTKKKDRKDINAIAMFGYSGNGVINVNGRDIKLRQVQDNLPDKNFKVGRGGYQIWKGKNISVRLDYVFTWLCPPKDEQCEVYYYKGVFDVHYGGERRKFRVVGFGGS